jgi:hypothetical protein
MLKIVLLIGVVISFSGEAFSQHIEIAEQKNEQPVVHDLTSPEPKPPQLQRGTVEAPIVVRILPTPKTADEIASDRKERENKSNADFWLIRLTGALAIVGAMQLIVFGLQARRLRQTVEMGAEQADDMKKYVAEAARAASAMEEVAKHIAVSSKAATDSVTTIKDSTTRQLRAYLCVNFGAVAKQNRETGFRFEPRLLLINVGHTPAHNVSFRATSAILPFPLPENFNFSLGDTPSNSSSVIGTNQNVIMSAAIDRLLTDDEIQEINTGGIKRLYIYGSATYEDVYHVKHTTNFCMNALGMSDGSFMGVFTKTHNDAD